MPFCEIDKFQQKGDRLISGDKIKIFYETYGCGKTKVLFIIGLAATLEGWIPQIKGLTGSISPNRYVSSTADSIEDVSNRETDGIEVCAFDNRGVGRSSIPTKRSDYTTSIMAEDVLALMDHLRWGKAHVVGHSMGAMIACKLAAISPERISSLALLNVTGGGLECFPKLIDRQIISILIRFLRARIPEERAAVDLDTHYTKEYLDEDVGSSTRRIILHQEYVNALSSAGMQSTYGFEGQLNACWTHNMSSRELEIIRSSGFLISVIHGRYDIIAQVHYARKLAEKLFPCARMVELHGAHLVSHERAQEVNQALRDLIIASQGKMSNCDWSYLSSDCLGLQVTRLSVSFAGTDNTKETRSAMFQILSKIIL